MNKLKVSRNQGGELNLATSHVPEQHSPPFHGP
jgi:hypothetical protein